MTKVLGMIVAAKGLQCFIMHQLGWAIMVLGNQYITWEESTLFLSKCRKLLVPALIMQVTFMCDFIQNFFWIFIFGNKSWKYNVLWGQNTRPHISYQAQIVKGS